MAGFTGFFLFAFLLFPVTSFGNFDFNANCLKAYEHILSLRLVTARQLIANEKKLHPDNHIVPLLENYIDYFYLLTTESKSEFDRLKSNKDTRLDILEGGNEESPYYLYAQAEVNLQWALIRGRYGEYFAAAREIKKANSQLLDNKSKFPAFHLNTKGLGVINAFLGNLPDGILKSTLSTLGIKGNLQAGINMLDKLAENLPQSKYEPFYEEVIFYYSFVLNDIAHSPAAYSKVMKFTARFSDSSLLKSYLQAMVSAKSGHNQEAIDILSDRPSGQVYQAFPYLDFLLANAKLNKLDLTATQDFNRFLQLNKGVNYIKDTYLRLGWLALLKGDTGLYTGFMKKTIASGYVYQEKDKQALSEAKATIPDLRLLKARLLFDGGYFVAASEILQKVPITGLASLKDKTEYYYRSGRLNDELGKDDKAIAEYQRSFDIGRTLPFYFAANAALQMGKIYQAKGNTIKARQAFNAVLKMKNFEYENSIKNQAKTALNKLDK